MNTFTKPTRAEAYQKMYAAIDADQVLPLKSDIIGDNKCLYEYPSGRRCIVGCLFTQEQIESIKELDGIDDYISSLARRKIGVDNIEFVTGLKLDELAELQSIHDELANNIVQQKKHDRTKMLDRLRKGIAKVEKQNMNLCSML